MKHYSHEVALKRLRLSGWNLSGRNIDMVALILISNQIFLGSQLLLSQDRLLAPQIHIDFLSFHLD